MTVAGVVLAGGRSTRMGTAKAALRWGGSTLVAHTCEVVQAAVSGPTAVVRAAGQHLPALPTGVEVLDDDNEGLGPVQGLAVALRAMHGRADLAFVAATDLPFLAPAFVRRVVRVLADAPDADVALPVAHGFPHPLAAAYRTSLHRLARQAVDRRALRLMSLVEQCRVVELDEGHLLADQALAAADPRLESVVNLNGRAEYERALAGHRG